MRWKRPAECRLCQCPVADTGVRMDKLNAEKLSEWWKQKLDTKLVIMDLANEWICQFCLWDARLEHEQYLSENQEPIDQSETFDWWNGFDNNRFFFKYYYRDAVIERCSFDASTKEKVWNVTVKTPNQAINSYSRRKQPTKCIYCQKTFPSKTKAHRHVVSNHKDETICPLCMLCFVEASALKKHINEHRKKNEIIPQLKCIYCKNQKFQSWDSFRYHMRKNHNNSLIQCNYTYKCASIYFKTENEKLEHIEKVHKSKADEIECEVCKLKLIRPHLNAHMRQFHDRSHNYTVRGETNCCYCQEEFTSKKSAFRHVKKAHSNIETFKCHECEICFESNELKKEHYQKVHRGDFRCIYCENWECSNRMNLRRHLRIKHQGQVIQCRYSNKCGLYFKTEEELKKHISESHESDKSNKLQCVYCSKFLPCNDLGKHMKIHHKSVAIKCNYIKNCRFYCLTKEEHETHILEVHQPGVLSNKIACPCCPKIFVEYTLLEAHAMEIHSERLFKCNVMRCRFLSVDKVVLKNHIQTQHAELKNLTVIFCSKCNFKSYNKQSLQTHEHSIHGTENLKCQHCPKKSFKSKFSIECHVRLMHIFKTCRHCKTHLSLSAIQNHNKVKICQFCKFASPCMFSHRRHERKCTHWKYILQKK